MFSEKMYELFVEGLMCPRAFTRATLEKGQAAALWFLNWHLQFNPTASGNVFRVCIHRYHLQGLYGLLRTLRVLAAQCKSMNTRWGGRLKCFVRFKVSRLNNSPTESGFAELRVCAGLSVLDGVRVEHLFSQILNQEVRGHRRMRFVVRRSDYHAVEKTLARIYGTGEGPRLGYH